jgi:hypothetical protein
VGGDTRRFRVAGLTSEVGKQAKTEKRFFLFHMLQISVKKSKTKISSKKSPLALILSKTAAPAGGHIVLSLDQGPCEHAIPNSQTIKSFTGLWTVSVCIYFA